MLKLKQFIRARMVVRACAHVGRAARDKFVLQPEPAPAFALHEHMRDGRFARRFLAFARAANPAPLAAIGEQNLAV